METVRVPHTWNVGKYEDYEGTAWYFKSFTVPEEMLSRHVELNFGATFYRSVVWLNGANCSAGTRAGTRPTVRRDRAPAAR